MAFIMNFQSPKTVEDLLDRFETDGLTNIDHIFHFEETLREWTGPRKRESRSFSHVQRHLLITWLVW